MRYLATTIVSSALVLGTIASTPAHAQSPERPTYAPPLSADFPFESKFVEVLGSKMHYVEVGEGDPLLLIHGNPTSSYLWRNVIPLLENRGRVVAIDLIGFGKSDKPELDYTFADHRQYVDGIIEALDLKDITLVVHDWGSALGIDYASRNEGNVKGIAMMEALIPPAFPVPSYEAMGEFADLFRSMRDPEKGQDLVMGQNFFIEQIIPSAVMRDLTEAEMAAYRAPFPTVESRKPVWVWPNEIPIAGEPAATHAAVEAYVGWLLESDLPKLHIYASPGAINPPEVAAWLASNLKNIETAFVGGGLHYIQEDQPEAIGRAVADWHRRLAE